MQKQILYLQQLYMQENSNHTKQAVCLSYPAREQKIYSTYILMAEI